MLTYKLAEETEMHITYHYFPEGKEEFGTVTFEKKTGKVSDIVLAKTDEVKWYANHMIEEFTAHNEFQRSGTIAWY